MQSRKNTWLNFSQVFSLFCAIYGCRFCRYLFLKKLEIFVATIYNIYKKIKGERNMKKVICKVEYDTETAALIKKHTYGVFGDTDGYEESLYVTESGKYFLYVNGGEDSIYPTENIKRMSADKAEEWRKAH